MAGMDRKYSVTMSEDVIEIETPTEKLLIKSEKRDKAYDKAVVKEPQQQQTPSASLLSSSLGRSNGVDHESPSIGGADESRDVSFNDQDEDAMSGISVSFMSAHSTVSSNAGDDDRNDDQNDDSKCCEDDETIKSEVMDVIEYMLELVEIVVPFYPTDQQKKQAMAQGKKGRDGQDDDVQTSDIEELEDEDSDYLEVIEEKLPVEMTIDLEPKPVGEDEFVPECVPRKYCFICGSSKKRIQVLKDGKIQSICSDPCLERFKATSGQKCIQCKNLLPADSITYHPKFGAIGSNICSIACLNKYEDAKGPKAKCRTCMKVVSSSGKSYHWQTMDFCSSKCIEGVFKSVGGFCVNCKSQVGDSALGKYSVRFGDVVRQFCCVKCLEQYKRRLKSCSFCQKELIQSVKQTVCFKEPNGQLKPRDFCNQNCVVNYRELREKKVQQEMVEEFEEAEFCSICAVYVDTSPESAANVDTYKIDHLGQSYFCCSATCVSALRYQLSIKALVCDGCYKYSWPLSAGTVLRYSGKIKIFCTKRCQSLFVLRTRRIQSCVCCRVKKYAFDLVEQFNHENGSSALFCSLNCMNILVDTDTVNDKLGKKVNHAKCFTCKKVARESVSKIFHSEDGIRGIRSFCSYSCITQYKNKVRQEQEQERINQRLAASHAAARAAETTAEQQAADRWTPNFTGQVVRSGNQVQLRPGQCPATQALQSMLAAPKHNYSTRTATGSVPPQVQQQQQQQIRTYQTGQQIATYQSGQQQIRNQPIQPRPLPNILQRNHPNLVATLANGGQVQQQQQVVRQIVQTQPQVPKKTEVLLMKPAAKEMVNKSAQICSSCITKSTQCRPSTKEIAVQTEE